MTVIEESLFEERNYIVDKMLEFNNNQVPFTQTPHKIDLAFNIKNSQGEIVAGINAIMYRWKCIWVDYLWVSDEVRGKGYGSLLLKKLEEEGKKQGSHLIHLDTFDWQAKDFYLKNGFELYGELDDCPKGHKLFYLKKYI
jgi:GNAT superfamily N-acetyltransferase